MQHAPIQKINWDVTYACPLRCTHCYSESGRRPARQLSPEDLLRVAGRILAADPLPKRMSISGGEPLLVKGLLPVAARLREGGIAVALFTGGWGLTDALAAEVARSCSRVCISLDGADATTHDFIRRRAGSFDAAIGALARFDRLAGEARREGRPPLEIGVEYTVVRSNVAQVERLFTEVASRVEHLTQLRVGAAMPIGLASRESFVERELLTDAEYDELLAQAPRLRALAPSHVAVEITDVRGYRVPDAGGGDGLVHLEPDGRARAFAIYEGTVGSALDEPLDALWRRALAWRGHSFVVAELGAVRTMRDWARATRNIDAHFGTDADRQRIAARPAYTLVRASRGE